MPITKSHPSRVRGLKRDRGTPGPHDPVVAPLAGAWIETGHLRDSKDVMVVAPLAGAWIETTKLDQAGKGFESHPSRVRGLKLKSSRERWP